MWRESVHFCVPYSETYVHRHIFHLEVFSTTDCLLPKDSGTCSGNFDNYYYNQQDKSCRVFQYGGCGGNSNNFKTKHECETKCLSKSFLDQHIQTDLSEDKTVLSPDINHLLCPGVNTAWKMSNYGVFFWFVFSLIRIKYGEIRSILHKKMMKFPADLVTFAEEILNGKLHFLWSGVSPYSVRMRENTNQEKLRIWTFFTQWK